MNFTITTLLGQQDFSALLSILCYNSMYGLPISQKGFCCFGVCNELNDSSTKEV